MEYLAHQREDGATQTIHQHLEGAARRARDFAAPFGSGEQAAFCAALHDMGKYSAAFQERIRGAPLRTDHATAGAQEAARQPGMGKLFAYCIAGHHGGLPAGGDDSDTEGEATLCGRLKRELEPCGAYFDENTRSGRPPVPPLRPLGKGGFTFSFYTRMLYSCLVDADFLDTEQFMSGAARGGFDCLETLAQRLNAHLAQFDNPTKPINEKRCEIRADCVAAAKAPRGLFSLTVPTGGGKTLSSLAFALGHALEHGLDRILYVVPYTSIIEQNAAVFADILGAKNVLQHHSNFDFSARDEDGILDRQKLAAENWDAPLIVTTNVQFFESLFAHKPSRCRKLHSIANSVIIFDEAQMFPTPYLAPCIRAIAELVQNYRCTAVLCSATQPALQFPGGMTPREICRDPMDLYRFFRRTRLVDRGVLSDEALLTELREASQVLCIVNTRRHAKALYEGLGEDAFHLSTLMCPAHRKAVIEEIGRRLDKGLPCRVVSTRLIEAGVDVDFPVVYRALAGVDSLVQSAGRCNRENKRPLSDVYVFTPETEDLTHLPAMQRPLDVARPMLTKYPDLLSPEAIRAYFTELYEYEGPRGLDVQGIVPELEAGAKELAFNFPRIAERFHIIDSESCPVLIPYGDAPALLERLRREGPSRDLLRALQPYTVSVYPHEFAALNDAGILEHVGEAAILTDAAFYTETTGLTDSPGGGRGIFC